MPVLKREQVTSGTTLEVLPGFNLEPELHVKDNLLIAADYTNFLTDSWEIPSNTRLEIVDGPRIRPRVRYQTVQVRVCDQPEIEGYVFWCELRASTKVVTPAPTA